ncbi:ABC transporter permease [Polynucleobacter sp. HIN8]|uniref:ABC transporter permease n=1 Tax=Polynucleobacter sp. HIN8 TaxID=3047867 RepID=UPI002572EAA9|nr:ABC transporter permease [Polynucleobacter sp. HIN8]
MNDFSWSYTLRIAYILAFLDIKQRYRRSFFGPFWITLSTAVMVGAIGLIFGSVLGADMSEFLPFLALGLIFWVYISGILQDCTVAFISSENLIKQVALPLSVYIFRIIFRNALILIHNLLILPFVYLILGKQIDSMIILFIPLSFIIVTIFLFSIGTILAVLCTRYRDLPQVVANIMQVFFYLTPIVWMPSLKPSEIVSYVLQFNVFNYVLSVLRDPFLGINPTSKTIILSLITSFFFFVAYLMLKKYKHRVVYWL